MMILKLFLFPVSILYGLVVKIRNLFFDQGLLKSTTPSVKTICVGNITVGGTGKTPHVDYLIQLLSPGFKIATLSRGYGRRTKGFRYVEANSSAIEVGDEPLQLKQKHPEIDVTVDEKRVEGIRRITADKKDIDIIILDDAFQHRYLKPGLSILLVDFNRPIYNDKFLPYGRLRDSVKEIRRAEVVIVTKCLDNLTSDEQLSIRNKLKLNDKQHLFFSSVEFGNVFPIFAGNNRKILLQKDLQVFAIAGIANPRPFYSFLEQKAKLRGVLTFPDHFQFTEKKISSIFDSSISNDDLVITTEKDAVRIGSLKNLRADIKERLFYIPIEIRIMNNKETEFNKIVTDYARKD